jgi:hypothetical protein
MKKFFKILALTLAGVAAIGMSACTEDGDSELTLSTESLTFAAEGGSQTVTAFKAGGGITAMPDADWMQVTVTGSDILVVVNATQDARNGSIKVNDSKTITVSQAAVIEIPVESVTLNFVNDGEKSEAPVDAAFVVGREIELTATVLPENATNNVLEWSVEDPAIATYVEGKLTAVSQGRTTLIAFATDNSGIIATMNISVHDIYVGGRITDGHANYATIWKNGVERKISERESFIFSIDVTQANDVYVAGYGLNMTMMAPEPILWTNGTEEILTAPGPGPGMPGIGIAHSVQVVGSDVYIAGQSYNPSYTATTWKNGEYTPVGPQYSDAATVYVAGADTYVCGYLDEAGKRYLTMWKNGTEERWSDNQSSTPHQMVVSGDDFYVVGITNDVVNDQASDRAALWVNGELQILNTEKQSEARSVYVNGDDVYVAGIVFDGGMGSQRATLWKNGEEIRLSEVISQAHYVSGVGSDVYVAGFTQPAPTTPLVTLWSNGEEEVISEGLGDAYAIGFGKLSLDEPN